MYHSKFITKNGSFFNRFKLASKPQYFLMLKLLVISSLFLISCNDQQLKTGFIDINDIYKEYQLSIAFEELIKNIENNAASNLLGLQADINQLNDSLTGLKNENIEIDQTTLKNYYELKLQFEKSKQNSLAGVQDSIKIYREKLNQDINQKIYHFAQKNGYDYVYSPAGSGAFMYADSSLNITKEVLKHLNK